MATEVHIPGPAECNPTMEGSVHKEDQVTQILADKFPKERIHPGELEINAREQTQEEMIQHNEASENKESGKGDEVETTQADSLENSIDNSPTTESVSSHTSPKVGDEIEEPLAQIRSTQIADDEQSEQESRWTEVSGKDTSDSPSKVVHENVDEAEEPKKTELSKADNGETSSLQNEPRVEKTVESLHEALEDTEPSGLGKEIGNSSSSDPQINLDDSADDKAVDGAEQKATVDSDDKIPVEPGIHDALQEIGDQNTEASASDQAQNRNETKERSIALADVEETPAGKSTATTEVASFKRVDDSQIKHEEHIEKENGKQSSLQEALDEKANEEGALGLQDSQIGEEYLRESEHVDTEKNEESTLPDKEIAHTTNPEDKSYEQNEDAEYPNSPEKLIILTENHQEITMGRPNDATEEDSASEANVRQIEQVKHLETDNANSSSNSTMEISDERSIGKHEGQSEDEFVQTFEDSDGAKDSPSVLSNKEREVTSMGTLVDMPQEFPIKSVATEKDNQEGDGAATTPGNSELLTDLVHESENKATENKENKIGDDSVGEVEKLKKGEVGELGDKKEINAGDIKEEAANTVEYSNIGSGGSEESGPGEGTEFCSAKDQHPTSDAQEDLNVKEVNEAEHIVEISELKEALDPIEKSEEKSDNVDASQVEEEYLRNDIGSSSNVVNDTRATNEDNSTLPHATKMEEENMQLSESSEYDKSKDITLLNEVHTKDHVIDHGELEDNKITNGDQNTEPSTQDVPEQTNEGSIVLAGTEETEEAVVTNDANSMLEGDNSEMAHDENVKNYIDSESLTEATIQNVNDEEASTMNEPQNADKYLRESENPNNEMNLETNPHSEDKGVAASPDGSKQIGVDVCSRESEYVNNEKDLETNPMPETNNVPALSEGTEQTGDANAEVYPEQEDNILPDSNQGAKEIGDKFLKESANSEENLESNPEPEVSKIHTSNEGTEQHRDEKNIENDTKPEAEKVSASKEGREQFFSTEEEILKADAPVTTINETNDAAYTESNTEVDVSQPTDEKELKRATETSLQEASAKEINDDEKLIINEGHSWENPTEAECSNGVKEVQSNELNNEMEDSTQKLPLEEKASNAGHVFLKEEQNITVDPQGVIDNEVPDAEEKALENVGETTAPGFQEDSIQVSEFRGETCIRGEGIVKTVLMQSKKGTESELVDSTSAEENTNDSQKTASDDLVTSTEDHQTETCSINEQVLTDISQENGSDVAEKKTAVGPDTETPKDDTTTDILDKDGECHSHNLEKDVESSENHDDEKTLTDELFDANSTENILAVEPSVKSSPEGRDEINKPASHQDSETLLEHGPTKSPQEIVDDQVESKRCVVDCTQVKNDEQLEKDVEGSNNHDDEATIIHEVVDVNSTNTESLTHETSTENISAIEENVRSLPGDTDLINGSASHQDRETEESKPYEVEITEQIHDKDVLTRVEGIQAKSMTTVEGSHEAFERSTKNLSEQSRLTETSEENEDDASSSLEKGEYIKGKENCNDEGKDNSDIQDVAILDRETEDQSNETIGDTEENIVQENKESKTTSNELKMQNSDEQQNLDTCSKVKTDETADIVEEVEKMPERSANTSDETGDKAQFQNAEELTTSTITSIEATEQLPAESLSHDLISEASSETGKLSEANEKEKPCDEYDNNVEPREDEAPKDPEKLSSIKDGINEVTDNRTDTETTIASEMPEEYHEPQQTTEEGSLKETASEIKPNDVIAEENFESNQSMDDAKDATEVELEQEEDTENQSVNIISELQQTKAEGSLQEIASERKPNDIIPEKIFESTENIDSTKDATKVEFDEKIMVEGEAESKSVNIVTELQQTAEEKSSEIKPSDVVQEENCESEENMHEAKDATEVELKHKTIVEEDTENQDSSSYEEEVMIEREPESEITKEDEAMTKETNEAIKNQNEKGFDDYIDTDDKTVQQAEIFSPANEATDRTESEKEKGAKVKEVSCAPDTKEESQALFYHKSIGDSVTTSDAENEKIAKQEEQGKAPEEAEQVHCDIKQTEKHEKTDDEKVEEALARKDSNSTGPKEASHGSDEKVESETSSRKDEDSKINIGDCHREELITEVHPTNQSQHEGLLNRGAAIAVIQNANEDEKAFKVPEEADIKVAEVEEKAIDANDLTSIKANPVEQEKLEKDLESIEQVQTSGGISEDEEDKTKKEKPIQEATETKTDDLETEDRFGPEQSILEAKEESPVQEPEVITKAEVVQTSKEKTVDPEDDASSKIKQSTEDDLHHLDTRKGEITTYIQPMDENAEKTSEGKEMNLVMEEEIAQEARPKEYTFQEDMNTLDTQEKTPSSDQGNARDKGDGPISSDTETNGTLELKDTKETIDEGGREAVAADTNPVEKRFDATNATDEEAATNATDEEAENPMSSEKSEEKGGGHGGHLDSCTKELIPESKIDQEQKKNSNSASDKLDCNEQNTLEIVSNISKDSQGSEDEVLQTENLPGTKSLDINNIDNDVPLASVESNSAEATKGEETFAPALAEHVVREDYADKEQPKTSIGNVNESVIQHEAPSENSQGRCEEAHPIDLEIEKPSIPQESLKIQDHSSENKDPIIHNECLPGKGQNEAGHEDVNTDDEKDDKVEKSGEHTKYSSGPESLVIVEEGDLDMKAAQKKPHNLLSGVGSKVKHSIAKVKKAITGKSSHHKVPSTKQN